MLTAVAWGLGGALVLMGVMFWTWVVSARDATGQPIKWQYLFKKSRADIKNNLVQAIRDGQMDSGNAYSMYERECGCFYLNDLSYIAEFFEADMDRIRNKYDSRLASEYFREFEQV